MGGLAIALLIGRLVLAAVFTAAGVAKLLDQAGSRRALAQFGVAERLTVPFAFALPLAELTIAATLLPSETARYGAIGALTLLALFTVAIAYNLSRGRAPDCHCFGQLHSTPAGRGTLARNLALLGLAGLVLGVGWSDPGPSAIAWLGELDGSGLAAVLAGALAVATALGGASLGLRLMRAYGRVLLRLEQLEDRLKEEGIEIEPDEPVFGLPTGSEAPAFSVPALDGGEVSLGDLLGGDVPVMLFFTDPGCGPCHALMPQIGRWREEQSEILRIAVVSGGGADEVRAAADEHEIRPLLLDEERELYDAYEANGTPSAVLIDTAGRIASAVAAGAESIERLVERTIAAGGSPERSEQGIAVGDPAPEATLADLDGAPRNLRQMLDGSETLVVFWNPACGFCREMRDDLKRVEARIDPEARKLLILSSGDADATRSDDFGSTVLLDPAFEVGSRYGAGGTPSAVRVDPDRRIASPLAVGIDEVLALARPGIEVHSVTP